MPIYQFSCKHPACGHPHTVGMQLRAFESAEARGFKFLKCPRCKRAGTSKVDIAAQARSQAVHGDDFTFFENAPDEILRGERTRTTTKAEAKRLMAESGVRLSGKSGKQKFDANSGVQRETATQIMERWRAEGRALPKTHVATDVATPAATKSDVSTSQNVATVSTEPVDSGAVVVPTLATSWPGLKKQAKSLGLNIPSKMRRPEVERLVRKALHI
jgi:hypothetical protein